MPLQLVAAVEPYLGHWFDMAFTPMGNKYAYQTFYLPGHASSGDITSAELMSLTELASDVNILGEATIFQCRLAACKALGCLLARCEDHVSLFIINNWFQHSLLTFLY